MASTSVGGGEREGGEEEKKKSCVVIDDSTKQKVRCLHSSVTLLFRHFFIMMIMKAVETHGFTEAVQTMWVHV